MSQYQTYEERIESGVPLPITRRTLLKGAAVTAGALTVGAGFRTFSGTASAATVETLYLTDSGGDNGGSFLTKLYSVALDAGTTRANLTLLTELTDTDFDQVDAIAASLDGTTIYMVDKNSKHLGVYDVVGDTFTDEGAISGLPGGVVLASFSPGGTLYVVSQADNTMYAVDTTASPPTATAYVTITGANVEGADIAFDSAGTLFLYVSGSQELYTVDYDDASGTFGQATLVGATGDFFTGLAVRDAGDGDLVGSNTTRDEIVVVDKTTGAQGTAFEMYLDGSRYAYGFGDMTVGALNVDTCEECDEDGLLAKYEFACVETDPDTGECVAYDFVFETGDDGLVTYDAGSFESKDGEQFEPISATFGTEYCTVWALVKAGQEFDVQELAAEDGQVTAEYVDPFAISFVAFYCTEAAAQAAADAFPSKGKGGRNR